MKVEELIIDGFKSYATRTVISGWDAQFNAITGLNGSGKSNILDAICFVLGISSMSTVRASNMQDLIYKRGQAGVTKASVTIVFDNSDKSNSPIGFNDSLKISVTRQIVLGGTSKYLINGHRAPQQSVLQLFQSVQLNINNPNFLIMQGKITKVLNMRPSEILSLIEEAAGTKMFEDRREKAERTMSKKETKLEENRTLLAEEIEPKLNKLRGEKRIFLEFQVTQTDLEKISRVVTAFDYHNMSTRRDSARDKVSSNERRMEELKTLISKTTDEIISLKEDLEQIKTQKKDELDKNGVLPKLEKQEGDFLNQISRINATKQICSQNLEENKKKIQKLQNTLESLSRELQEKLDRYREIETAYKQDESTLNQLKEEHKSRSELLSTLSIGISSTGEAETGYTAQLSSVKEQYNETEVNIQTHRKRIEFIEKELAYNGPKLQQARKENEQAVANYKHSEMACASLEKELTTFGYDPEFLKQLRKEESDLKQQIYQMNNDIDHLKRKTANLDFHYEMPGGKFDPNSVKGIAAQLFSLDEQNFYSATALQVCAGGRLFNVVVDNENTAAQLLERGRLRKRATIIPLNKIAARTLNDNIVNMAKSVAPGRVELALNLIGYEEEVRRAMEFIFGSSLVCKDAEAAKMVTFNPKIRTRSITLDGDVYDPEGTLSGGSRNNTSSLLIDIQRYNNNCNLVKELETKLNDIAKKIAIQFEISNKTKNLQKELELAQHKLKLSERNLQSNTAAQLIRKNEELESEIAQCKEEIKDKTSQIKQLKKQIAKIEKDADEFSHDKGSKLDELRREVESMSVQISEEEQRCETQYDAYQNFQLEIEQLGGDIDSSKDTLEQAELTVKKLQTEVSEHDMNLRDLNQALQDKQVELEEERNRLMGIDDELKEIEALIKSKTDIKNNAELDIQKINHELNKLRSTSNSFESELAQLLDEHEWLSDESQVAYIIEQHASINLAEYRERGAQLQERFDDMKRKVNPNIMSMIESVEKKESALKTMIRTIEKDKVKIQETITKLNEYKRETLIKTWEKVTEDFGNVFADLLPNSFAKLVPCEGKDITEGLEVKVKLGSIWKESLIELSGGQRSLIALSLIMALLQFRPAPMYILDEVDAALDLSHTQNIGHLIKTRFKGSQFIVVSLKEGMFTNANRVFRTRFQDGTSVVSIM
ncbi:condensin subunit SMC2 KNAG_0L01160 [Huiozyma naganishii CBS 8797]|uniref:Structural maintenance of chromosomes protein n=1 Tax=Huiozyma naganishii (strain ATCC MYA-139 / BCRC 22969 / CBS 8797 / KCTC 17520 / NBRC 10181 / NCYC 3082 / Yp74L-3) TaxID=1071383 RepID=J7SB46_HUIN7|nr:hypothetical protein KNAG_0L01160 [Kazachstania naganishii CBS 8797]CCK72736.1 hypothetical protein KNAG_0L01160 [Kazachstania naganishii CBS 8797]